MWVLNKEIWWNLLQVYVTFWYQRFLSEVFFYSTYALHSQVRIPKHDFPLWENLLYYTFFKTNASFWLIFVVFQMFYHHQCRIMWNTYKGAVTSIHKTLKLSVALHIIGIVPIQAGIWRVWSRYYSQKIKYIKNNEG